MKEKRRFPRVVPTAGEGIDIFTSKRISMPHEGLDLLY